MRASAWEQSNGPCRTQSENDQARLCGPSAAILSPASLGETRALPCRQGHGLHRGFDRGRAYLADVPQARGRSWSTIFWTSSSTTSSPPRFSATDRPTRWPPFRADDPRRLISDQPPLAEGRARSRPAQAARRVSPALPSPIAPARRRMGELPTGPFSAPGADFATRILGG